MSTAIASSALKDSSLAEGAGKESEQDKNEDPSANTPKVRSEASKQDIKPLDSEVEVQSPESNNSPSLASSSTPPHFNKQTFAADWQSIRKLREDIWRLRSKVQQQREVLRGKQLAKSTADDRYIQRIRLVELAGAGALPIHLPQILAGKRLEELYQACEVARMEYGPLEDDCNILEDQLGRKEWELTRSEERFVENFKEDFVDEDETILLGIEESGDLEHRDSESDKEYHPLVAEYLSRLGNLDILQERYKTHIEERAILEAEKIRRAGVERALAEEDDEWLAQSQGVEESLLETLQQAEGDVEVLRKRCSEASLLDGDGEPRSFMISEGGESFSKDIEHRTDTATSTHIPRLTSEDVQTPFSLHHTHPHNQPTIKTKFNTKQYLNHDLPSPPPEIKTHSTP